MAAELRSLLKKSGFLFGRQGELQKSCSTSNTQTPFGNASERHEKSSKNMTYRVDEDE